MYIDPSCTIAAEYTCSKCLRYNQPWAYHPPAITIFRWGKSTHPHMKKFWFWVAGAEGSQDDSECQNGSSANSQHIAIRWITSTLPMQFFENRVPMGTPKTIESSLYIPMIPYKMVILAVDTWLSSIFSLTQISRIPILVGKIINSHSGCLNPDSCRLNWRLNPIHFVSQILKWIQISTIFVV